MDLVPGIGETQRIRSRKFAASVVCEVCECTTHEDPFPDNTRVTISLITTTDDVSFTTSSHLLRLTTLSRLFPFRSPVL